MPKNGIKVLMINSVFNLKLHNHVDVGVVFIRGDSYIGRDC